jgi:tetratricopeptide (TPR) repeat protein
MTTLARRLPTLLAALCVACVAAEACAEDSAEKAKTRALNQQGLELLDKQRFDEAEAPLNAAMALCDGPLHGENDCVVGVSENLAAIAEHRGDLPTAERLLNRALAATLAGYGETDRSGTLQQKLGHVLLEEQRFAPAKTALEQGLAVLWKLGDAPHSWAATMDIAEVYVATGRPELAGALLEKASVLTAAAGPSYEAQRQERLGLILWSLGHFKQGESVLRRSAELFAAAGEPDLQQKALVNLAHSFMQIGAYDRAEPVLQARYDLLRKRGDSDPLSLASAEVNLAEAYVSNGRTELASAMVASALSRSLDAERSTDEVGDMLSELGRVQLALNRPGEARRLFDRAMATPSRAVQGQPRWKADAELSLGDLDRDEGRLIEAEGAYRAAAEDFAGIGDVKGELSSLTRVADALTLQERFDDSEALLRDVRAKAKARLTPDPFDVGQSEAALARLMNRTDRFAEAEALSHDALAQFGAAGGRLESLVAESFVALGLAEAGQGRYAEGAAHARDAIRLVQTETPWDRQTISRSKEALCDIVVRGGGVEGREGCEVTLTAPPKAPASR